MRTPAPPRRPALATVPPELPFAQTLARAWFDRAGRDPVANGDGLILVPNSRLARTLAERFLEVGQGAALLVPRIEAIGMSETGLAPAGEAELPPEIAPMRRLAMLTRLVLAYHASRSVPIAADRAWALAEALAGLLDEAARADVDLASGLPTLVPDELAGHWRMTLEFLEIVTSAWPDAASAAGGIDPARRHAMLLDLRAGRWRDDPPPGRVWLAGLAAATPAQGRLARVVACLPGGCVVFPGLDLALDETGWAQLSEGHPQAGMRDLLAAIGAERAEVAVLGEAGPDGPEARERADRAVLLARAMLPAGSIGTWRTLPPLVPPAITSLVAADQQEEAVAIALALRDAVEQPGRRAALVTPDRSLARRVAAELARFGIIADDSAGESLAETPQAAFLRLVAANAADGFAPADLLALLKHPLAGFGLNPAETRRLARRLERARLRGPRPPPGLDGLRRGARDASRSDPFLDRIERVFAPLLALFGRERASLRGLAEALIRTAEAACATDASDGASRLWAEEEGEALAVHLAAWTESLGLLGEDRPSVLPGLLRASFGGTRVHGRRSLRGREALETHPRVAIWGLLEARGQGADLIVLGGLVEGVWPSATDPGPWMGRNMRARVGLPSPETICGIEAHDFVALAAAGGRIVLSRPKRRERAPAVASRFVVRLEACLAAAGTAFALDPSLAWARALDQPGGPIRPSRPPEPRPPVHARPRKLSVTEIETWLVDPYAIYARRILRLEPLRPLEEEADRAVLGTLVHEGLAHAFAAAADGGGALDADTIERHLAAALAGSGIRPGVAGWWGPRLSRMAGWVASAEAARRARHGEPAQLVVEVRGEQVLEGPAGPFVLTGRADRIERGADGRLSILDYKTGSMPTRARVIAGWSPQLPLEATMALCGAFGTAFQDATLGELTHWKLSGGREPGQVLGVDRADDLARAVETAWHGLEERIAAFDDPGTAYLAEPDPAHPNRFSAYATLARVQEWRLVGAGVGADPE